MILPPSQMDISISIRQPKQEGKGEKDDIITFRQDKHKYVHLLISWLGTKILIYPSNDGSSDM